MTHHVITSGKFGDLDFHVTVNGGPVLEGFYKEGEATYGTRDDNTRLKRQIAQLLLRFVVDLVDSNSFYSRGLLCLGFLWLLAQEGVLLWAKSDY